MIHRIRENPVNALCTRINKIVYNIIRFKSQCFRIKKVVSIIWYGQKVIENNKGRKEEEDDIITEKVINNSTRAAGVTRGAPSSLHHPFDPRPIIQTRVTPMD